jgi:hypothetical protein
MPPDRHPVGAAPVDDERVRERAERGLRDSAGELQPGSPGARNRPRIAQRDLGEAAHLRGAPHQVLDLSQPPGVVVEAGCRGGAVLGHVQGHRPGQPPAGVQARQQTRQPAQVGYAGVGMVRPPVARQRAKGGAAVFAHRLSAVGHAGQRPQEANGCDVAGRPGRA